ncbi:MAG: YkgJ family cysteine cluster protein [Bacteriovorax sp.]|jgi:Fe-S-cluster containining protein|nr:YkgJ family cysteine cluster protein [Bacteriovorax sp.]
MKKNIQEHLNNLASWTKYKKGLCSNCAGTCCYMPVEVQLSDLIRLKILDSFHIEFNEREQVRDALKNPAILRYTPSSKKYTLRQKPDGSCFFLDANKLCTQYDTRPETCRNHPQVGPRPGYCAYMKK